jgi:hypothetical protein
VPVLKCKLGKFSVSLLIEDLICCELFILVNRNG